MITVSSKGRSSMMGVNRSYVRGRVGRWSHKASELDTVDCVHINTGFF